MYWSEMRKIRTMEYFFQKATFIQFKGLSCFKIVLMKKNVITQ